MKEGMLEMQGLPKPVGPYSLARRVGDWLFVSGQIALDPVTGKLIKDSIEAETEQVLRNVQAVLESEGFTLKDVVDVTIFLTDIDFFPAVNQVYERFFSPPYPARKTLAVTGLPAGARVEISVIACKIQNP